jgi:mono/diheme cytochrome c family protein
VKASLLGTALILCAAVLPAAAQDHGDPGAGKELAGQLCTACHIIGTEQVGSDAAPPFPVIAKDPEITPSELHAWLDPAHPVLPDLALTPQQIADINAYLDALHGADIEAAPPRSETEEPPRAIERAPPEKLGEPIEPSN